MDMHSSNGILQIPNNILTNDAVAKTVSPAGKYRMGQTRRQKDGHRHVDQSDDLRSLQVNVQNSQNHR